MIADRSSTIPPLTPVSLLETRSVSRQQPGEPVAGIAAAQSGIIRRKWRRKPEVEPRLVIRKTENKYRHLFLESQLMKEKLHQLTRRLISAHEDERKAISRELHDDIVQQLVGINIALSALSNGGPVGTHTMKVKVAHISRLVENSVKAVHRFARELRPAILDDLGLIPALDAYRKSVAARKKIKIRMTARGRVEALGSAKRTALFRVAQEALTNVARHAHATKSSLSIREISDTVRMEISDNGRSFHVGNTLLAKNPKRLGLVGMKERIEMVGGSLTIVSAPGKGTTVRADIPIDRENL